MSSKKRRKLSKNIKLTKKSEEKPVRLTKRQKEAIAEELASFFSENLSIMIRKN